MIDATHASAQPRLDPPPAALRLTGPTRFVNTKTWTCKAELLDANGDIDWRIWNTLGSISAVRVSTGASVPTSITVFETFGAGAGGGTPPADSIRFYNGVGSVSITLDNGASEPAGDIAITVVAAGVQATRIVTVLDAATPGLFQNLSGTLAGDNLIWEPTDGVIHLTGNVTVPAGSTLTIRPGTLIMVDSGPSGAGTKIIANGGWTSADGTAANPILFFPTAGPPAMSLPQTQLNNSSSWGGIDLGGTGASVLRYVFVTGAGNNPITGHPRPRVIYISGSHSLTATDCVFADSPGKILHGASNGTYTIQRCLFSRNGIGGEFLNGGYTLNMEDTWLTRIGRAPEAANADGDILHVDYPSSVHLRRCVLTDGGDDVVDHSNAATPVLEDCIIYDVRDKVVSIGGGGSITMTNCLIFNVPSGIVSNGVPAYLTQCTLGNNTNLNGQSCGSSTVQSTIFWPSSVSTCCGNVAYTLVANAGNLGCGVGNFSADPLFVNAAANDYRLQPGSPALNAGPGGGQIGFLGLPASAACVDHADCDDGLYCNGVETCQNGVCVAGTPVPNCCENDAECSNGNVCDGVETCVAHACVSGAPLICDDGNVCTDDTCSSQSGCIYTPDNANSCSDGNACNGLETCSAGTCLPGVPPDCDDGNACTTDSCDSQLGCQHSNAAAGTPCGNPSDTSCDNPDTCDGNGACLANHEPDGASCGDGLFCNGAETCLDGACQQGGDPCPGAICDESADACVTCLSSADCDDGLFCNGAEQCVSGTCQSGSNPCGNEQCNESMDACVECLSDAHCDDANACTVDSCSAAGTCEHSPINCDDGIVCTDDVCDPMIGCLHTSNCPAGQQCNSSTGQCQTQPLTVTFRHGVGGYSGTVDTFLRQQAPTESHGALEWFEWDATEGSTGLETLGLVYFGGIFGAQAGQVPFNAQVHSATLTLTVRNSGQPGMLHQVLVDWNESSTYEGFGGDPGAGPDEYGAAVATMAGTIGVHTADVTTSVQAWIANPTANRGWIIRHTGPDGVEVWSREAAAVADRPSLEIQYSLPPPVEGDIDHDGDVDAGDLGLLLSCMNGPDVPAARCDQQILDAADFDLDADLDLADFARLQTFCTANAG